jgi:hypothetical protein
LGIGAAHYRVGPSIRDGLLPNGIMLYGHMATAGEIHARERAMPYRVRLKLRGVHWRINSGTIYDSKTPRAGDQIEVEIDGRHVLARVGDVRSYRPKMTGASVVDEIDAEEI